MIRLFVCDLDGTLLNENHETDEIIHEALLSIVEYDKIFAIATGRHMHDNSFDILNMPDIPYYMICMNGALIKDTNHKTIYKKAMNKQIVEELFALFPSILF